MNRKGYGYILALCGLAVSLATVASADDEFNHRGAFIGLGASGFVSGFQGVLGRADYGNTAGLNFHGGYRLNEYIAFDGVFEYGNDFGRGKSRNIGDQVITHSSTIQTSAFTVGPKLILPLGRFQPYLDGGIGFINANGNVTVEDLTTGRTRGAGRTGSGFAGRFGGGIDVFVAPKWSLYVDNAYTIPGSGPTDVYYYSFGVGGRYNF
jgi:opacity protein-like surface antigen